MARPSSIDRLPAAVRELIAGLRADGRTIDEILGALAQMDVRPSRSALGRHVQKLDAADPAALGQVVDGLRREVRKLRLDLGAAMRRVQAALEAR